MNLGRQTAMGALLGALLAAGPLAAELLFEASVDRTRSGEAEPIRLTLTLRSDESLDHVPAPEIDLKDFYAEGPAISTQISMVNFQTSYTRELTYTLYPRRTGRITLGPARLKMGSQVHQTRAIEVEIAKGSTRPAPRSAPRQESAEAGSIEDQLFVLARSDRQRVYVGQQVTLDYELYYRFRLHNVGFKELPTFAGFWVKELFVAQQLQGRRETMDGVAFTVAPLRKVALFPTSAGSHAVEPLAISCEIPQQQTRRGNLFDDFFTGDPFFGRTQTVLVRSEPVRVEVRPLPQEGRPPEFGGAVGHFALKAQAEPTHVQAGDPVTLRVEISGQGNLDAVKAPAFVRAGGIKVYDPKVESEEKVENGLYGGRRVFEYILIPEKGGMMEIPPVRFAYFDPQRATYQVLESEPIFVHSRGSAADQEAQGYGLSRRDIEQVGQDIRYIKPDLQELGGGAQLYRSALFWSFQGALPLAFLGLLLYQRHQQRLAGDAAYARRRRARGEAGKRLRRARELRAAGKSAEFHAELQRAVLSFLGDRLNLAAAGLTSDDCAEALEKQGVEEQTIEALRELLARCDLARFGAVGARGRDMEEAQQQAEDLLGRLEKQI